MTTCIQCRVWDEPTGQCRARPPVMEGWPKTSPTDWCGEWLKPDAVATVENSGAAVWAKEFKVRVGVNAVYVRDFPEQSALWLFNVLCGDTEIPAALRPLLQSPLSGLRTAIMDMTSRNEAEEDADRLLRWAHAIDGGDDPAVGDESGIMRYVDDGDDAKENARLLAELPDDHPWKLFEHGRRIFFEDGVSAPIAQLAIAFRLSQTEAELLIRS